MNSFPSLSITKMMYGWSKWGGATHGLAKESLDEWYCQVCGEKQTKMLPSYMFPYDSFGRDFVRICARCKAKAKLKDICYVFELINLIKGI